jgi:anti-anti-sigma factor
MKTTLNEAKKLLTVQLSGDLTSTNAGELREHLATVLNADTDKPAPWRTLRLELSGAKMVDSVGLNLVVTLLRAVQRLNGKLQVTYTNPNVLRTFQFTRLDKHIELIQL